MGGPGLFMDLGLFMRMRFPKASGFPSNLATVVIGHDQGADEIDDDGRAGKQGEQKKTYAEKGRIDVEVFCEASQYAEEPFVGG